ncbi:flagellin N-terminal helical domain-containing protein [Arenibaculum pallidiluteum]|uniref:flagellin N-terminal helical domain-containing protein n=1 Tax=Arenibaculum pallidiluteum TaxID=2812559 RepID=UPI001A9645EB|nr:flagellin [Arenibaculum pallidiluteum]
MASIMTNGSAMTALQTLRAVTSNLEAAQDRISTGFKVAVAKDNASYWSISTTMKSDVAGFKAVSDALGLGTSTLISASNGADQVKDMLVEMKARIVAGQSKGTDPKFIQDEVNQFISQIESIVSSASFNGDNLLKINYAGDGSAKDQQVDILATLSRGEAGVTPSYITFSRQDMRTDSIVGRATIEQEVVSTEADKASVDIKLGAAGATFINGQNLGLGAMTMKFTKEDGSVVNFSVDLSGQAYDTDLATTQGNLETAINTALDAQLGANVASVAFTGDKLTFTVEDANTDTSFTAKIEDLWVGSKEGDAFGGLADIKQIDIANNAERSLKAIDDLLTKVIDKAAVLGSIENRVEIQTNFVSKLVDAMNKGIGLLVDADMNEESSRLQALQVQQQLATQALSIANQGPQNILSLFR